MLLMIIGAFSVFEWGVVDLRTGLAVSQSPSSSPYYNPEPYDQGGVWEEPDGNLKKPVHLKKPVVYFYGDVPDNTLVRLDVDQTRIMEAVPVPEGSSWRIKKPTRSHQRPEEVPWFDPQASDIVANDLLSNYLFYEIVLTGFENKLLVDFTGVDRIKLTNRADYPIYDIMCVIRVPSEDSQVVTKAGFVKGLEPGQSVELNACCPPEQKSALKFLRSMGFTQGAAQAFVDEWWDDFTAGDKVWNTWESQVDAPESGIDTPVGLVSVVYRLPQTEIDKLCPLHIEPKPQRVVRAWWVLVRSW